MVGKLKESKPVSETDATRNVRGLALGVLFVSTMQFLGGVVYLTIFGETLGSEIWLGGLLIGLGTLFFVLGFFLFKKQSYPAAVVLTVLMGLLCGLNLLNFMISVFSAQDGGAGGALMSVLFFSASYSGMKSAKALEKIRGEKISPAIFS